jgi:hypothetical protein
VNKKEHNRIFPSHNNAIKIKVDSQSDEDHFLSEDNCSLESNNNNYQGSYKYNSNVNDSRTSFNGNRNYGIGNQSVSSKNKIDQNRHEGIAFKHTERANYSKQLNHMESRNSNPIDDSYINEKNYQNEYDSDNGDEGPEPSSSPPPAYYPHPLQIENKSNPGNEYHNNDNYNYKKNVKNNYPANDDINTNSSYKDCFSSTNGKQRSDGSNAMYSTALPSKSDDYNTNDHHNKYERLGANRNNGTVLSFRSSGGTGSGYSGDLDTHIDNGRNNADCSNRNSSNDIQKSARRSHSVNSGNYTDRTHSTSTANSHTQDMSIAEQRTLLEKKHKERRERVAALHKQAEERVHLRQKDKERLLT